MPRKPRSAPRVEPGDPPAGLADLASRCAGATSLAPSNSCARRPATTYSISAASAERRLPVERPRLAVPRGRALDATCRSTDYDGKDPRGPLVGRPRCTLPRRNRSFRGACSAIPAGRALHGVAFAFSITGPVRFRIARFQGAHHGKSEARRDLRGSAVVGHRGCGANKAAAARRTSRCRTAMRQKRRRPRPSVAAWYGMPPTAVSPPSRQTGSPYKLTGRADKEFARLPRKARGSHRNARIGFYRRTRHLRARPASWARARRERRRIKRRRRGSPTCLPPEQRVTTRRPAHRMPSSPRAVPLATEKGTTADLTGRVLVKTIRIVSPSCL